MEPRPQCREAILLELATVARARNEYDAFAPYYDAFTAASDYEAWTRELLALAARPAPTDRE